MTSPLSRNLAAALAVIAASLPLVYLPFLYEAATYPRYTFIAIMLVGMAVILYTRSDPSVFVWHPILTLTSLFLAWIAISVNWSPDSASVYKLLQFLCGALLVYLAMQIREKRRITHWIVPAILLGALAAGILGILQYFGLNPFHLRLFPNSIASTFINRSHAAVYFDLIPFLSLFAILGFNSKSLKLLSALTLAASFAFIMLSQNRGSPLSLGAATLVLTILLMLSPRLRFLLKQGLLDNKNWLILSFVIIVTLVLAPGGMHDTKWRSINIDDPSSSSATRLALYANSAEVVLQAPLTGQGFGSFRTSFRPHSNAYLPAPAITEDISAQNLHNDYYQILLETGVIGLFLFLLVVGYLLSKGIRDLYANDFSRDESAWIKRGIFLSLIVSLTHALVSFPLFLPTSGSFFWVYLGLFFALHDHDKRIVTSRLFRPVVLFAGLLLALSLPFSFLPHLLSNAHLYTATRALINHDCKTGLSYAKKAFATFPFDFVNQNRLAQAIGRCPIDSPQGALEQLNLLLRIDATNLRARTSRGKLFLMLQKPDLADQDYRYVARVLPLRHEAYAGIADASWLKDDIQTARFYYRAALNRYPEYEYAITRLKQLNQQKGKTNH